MGSLTSRPSIKPTTTPKPDLSEIQEAQLHLAYLRLQRLSVFGELRLKYYSPIYFLEIDTGQMTYRAENEFLCEALNELERVCKALQRV